MNSEGGLHASPVSWELVLRSSALTAPVFTEHLVSELRTGVAWRTLEQVGSTNILLVTAKGTELKFDVENLWRELQGLHFEDRLERLRRWIRGTKEELILHADGDRPEPGTESILPVIKSSDFIESYRKQVSAQAVPADKAVAFLPQTRPFAPDMHILYVLDLEDSMRYISVSELKERNMTLDELHRYAVDNLRCRFTELETQSDGPLNLISCGGDYDASLLLNDSVWVKLAAEMGAAPIACIPTRNTCLYTSETSAAGLSKLRDFALRFFQQGSYPISLTMLRWDLDNWTVFECGTPPSRGEPISHVSSKRPWWRFW